MRLELDFVACKQMSILMVESNSRVIFFRRNWEIGQS